MFDRIRRYIKSRQQVLRSLVGMLPRVPTGLRESFSSELAVQQFNSWVYVATKLNANAAANIPLRLYVRETKNRAFITRSISKRTARFLAGERVNKPSGSVLKFAGDIPDGFKEVTESHPLTRLLGMANPWMTGFELTYWRHVFLQLTGNFYMHVANGALGIPQELWPLPSQWVKIITGKTETDPFVEGYRFGTSSRKQVTFAPDEVVHFRYPNPRSMYYGMGNVEACWNAVQQNVAAHEHDLATWENGARPDYAIILKNVVGGQDELDNFEARLKAKLEGRSSAGRFVSFGSPSDQVGIELKPLQWPPGDLTGREEILEEISGAWGTPITKLKANDPNRANAETGDAGWMRDTISYMLRLDEETLNQRLLPLFPGLDGDAFLAYDNPVPEDEAFLHTIRMDNVREGVISRNEVRVEQGKDESAEPNMDVPLVTAGLVPIANAGAAAISIFSAPQPQAPLQASPQVSTSPPPSAETAADSSNIVGGEKLNGAQITAAKDVLTDLARGILTPIVAFELLVAVGIEESKAKRMVDATNRIEAAPSPLAEETASPRVKLHSALWTVPSPSLMLLKVQTTPIVFDKLIETITDTLLRHRDLAGVDANALAAAIDLDRLRADVGDALKQAAQTSLDNLPTSDVAFDLHDPRVQEFLDNYIPRLARSISTTSAEAIGRIIADTVRTEGADQAAVRSAIMESPAFSADGIANRADMIARTELARAQVAGTQAAWRQSGVVIAKRWVLSPDPCEFCKALANQFNAISLDSMFAPQGAVVRGTAGGLLKLDYEAISGPPLHPNCRCDLEAILDT
jgi:phage portal protein BeeE